MSDIKSNIKVFKLTEKKTVGYRCTTNDFIAFESNIDTNELTISDFNNSISLELTPHTIETLLEFIRYIKSDESNDK